MSELDKMTRAYERLRNERAESFARLQAAVGKCGLTPFQAEADLEIESRIEAIKADRDHLRMVVQMTVASQGWDGNDPDDAAWTTLYRLAREALEGGPGR